jgi:hypothetical protein
MWHALDRREMHAGLWLENPEGNKPLVGPNTNGITKLKRISELRRRCADWIRLAQEKD